MANAVQQAASTILNKLDAGGDFTQGELSKTLELSSGTTKRALKLLLDEGSVEKYKNGGPGFRYRASPVDVVEAAGDDASIEASEEAILKAEGLLDDDNGTGFTDQNGNPVEHIHPVDQHREAQKRKRTRARSDEATSLWMAAKLSADDDEAIKLMASALNNIPEEVRHDAVKGAKKSVEKCHSEGSVTQPQFHRFNAAVAVIEETLPAKQTKQRASRSSTGKGGRLLNDGTPKQTKVTQNMGRPIVYVRPDESDFPVGRHVEQRVLDQTKLLDFAGQMSEGELVVVVRLLPA